MAAVIFPQEAVVQYVNDLLQIAGLAMRDSATLTRQAASLMGKPHHGRVLGQLRTYANERKQFGANEVREIVADMETFRDPKIVEQQKKIEADRKVREKERHERDEAREKASWERGGDNFNRAIGALRADAHALIYMAKVIEDSGKEPVIDAMSDWVYSAERKRLFDGLKEALKPPPLAPPVPAKRCSRRGRRGRDDKVVRLFNDGETRP